MKRLSSALLLGNLGEIAQAADREIPPTYRTVDFTPYGWYSKPKQNWQSEGKRRKPRTK